MRKVLASVIVFALLLLPYALEAGTANPMHPGFVPLDADAQPAQQSGQPVSSDKTCGGCHDAEYINGHSSHGKGAGRPGCIECHYERGSLTPDENTLDENGLLKREAVKISAPSSENCGACHGLIHSSGAALSLPEDYVSRLEAYDITRNTGAVIAGQNVSDSLLNIRNKETLNYPWDVHSARMVKCIACHYSPNNPAKVGGRRGDLDYLSSDPRRISTADYLKRPDHRLAAASCTVCHDPLATHEFLPYRERHFAVLKCSACHVSALKGPALKSLDSSVLDADGLPPAEYRGFENADSAALNAAFTSGYTPYLYTSGDENEDSRIAPFNIVTETFWVYGADGVRVPPVTLRRVYLDGGQYKGEILKAFDADGDAQLSAAELRLNTDSKVGLVAAALEKLGFAGARLKIEITPHEIQHGIMPGKQARKDCARCHERDSSLNRDVELASFVPAGVKPELLQKNRLRDAGEIERSADGALLLKKNAAATPYYVFGHTRASWSDTLGLLSLIAVTLGVALHGGYRIYTRKRRKAAHGKAERVYMYSAYERIWHWVMAFSVLALIITGLQIHFAGNGRSLALHAAVSIHNFFAVVLAANAFLSLFYHLASNAIRQFIPSRDTLKHEVAAQTLYYLKDIFIGNPHPIKESPDRKLNVLQQITYLLLLNLLLPMQIVTGILIWGVAQWPELAARFGGMLVIAPLHNLGSWLFVSFFVLHFYLTTTGRSVTANIRAMIDGYKDIEAEESAGSYGGRNG